MYIRDLLKPKVAGGYTLRSEQLRLLQVPKTKCKSFRVRAFAHSGPSLWNALPLEIRLNSNIDWLKTTCARKILKLNDFDFYLFLFQCCILLL